MVQHSPIHRQTSLSISIFARPAVTHGINEESLFSDIFKFYKHVGLLYNHIHQPCSNRKNDIKRLGIQLAKHKRHIPHEKIKSNLHHTRDITPKRVTSGGIHLRGSAPGQHSSEDSSQGWRTVDNTASF